MGMYECFTRRSGWTAPLSTGSPTSAQRAVMDKRRLPLGPASSQFSQEAHLAVAREWLARVDAGRIGVSSSPTRT